MLSKNEIKKIRALHQKKYRDLERCFLVEGERLIRDVLERHPSRVMRLFLAQNFDAKRFDFNGVSPEIIDEQALAQLTTSKSPQGIIALLSYPENHFEDSDFTLVLDGVQDPGNLGTIIRTMAWFGMRQLVCSHHTVDFCNPKVVQASMGAVFDVNIIYTDLASFLDKQEKPVYGALLAGKSMHKVALQKPAILIMGNEGNGISVEIQQFITKPIFIPKYGVGESLNVATATAIFLNSFAQVDKN